MSRDIISIKDIHQKLINFRKEIVRKWLMILISVMIFSLLGLAVALIKKPVYIAKLSFVLEENTNQSAMSSLAGLASQFGIIPSGGSSTFNSDNIVEILKSRNIVQKALLTKSIINGKPDFLINRYLSFSGYYDDWSSIPKLKNIRFTTDDASKFTNTHDSILNIVSQEIIKKIIEVDKLKAQLDIIVIKTSSKDEIFSNIFTQNLISAISEFYIQTKTQRARETLEFLQHRADSSKIALDVAEMQFAKWQDASNQMVKYQGQIERAKLMRNVEILQVVYSEILKNLELSKMNLLNITPLVKIIDKPIMPLDTFFIPIPLGMSIGAAAGLILAVVFLFLKMIIKDSLKEDSDLD